jgi:selenocysteine-specific elongation factor
MVAGATGIDVAMLVVAADEGVMPQTREHLAILSLLGVHSGVVALTKRDLVDADWLALVEEDVRDALASSTLAGAPIVPVSATTGAGLDALRHAIATVAHTIAQRPGDDLFRLPIDRAFTVKGTGTVVTGTVWSGSLAREATIRVMPSGATVRVRGLHAHGRATERVQAGDRAAIALAGVELDQVARGAVLVQGAGWRAARILRADVALLPDAPRPLGPRTRVRLHLGTSEVSARLVVPGGALAPGQRTSARVVVDEPIVARAGDRFVLRSASPVATLGGGVVVDPVAPVRARPWPAVDRTPSSILSSLLEEAGSVGVAMSELPVRLGIAPAALPRVVAALDTWSIGDRLIGANAAAALRAEAMTTMSEYHEQHPLEPGAPLQWLRSRLRAPEEVSAAVLDALGVEGRIAVEQGVARRVDFMPRLTAPQERLRDAFIAALSAGGQEPPALEELAGGLDTTGTELATLARLLAREGALVAVEPGRYYLASVVGALLARLESGMTPGVEYGPAELRDLLGFSRKYLIPFLEYSDRTGHTVRDPSGKRRRAGT